MRRRNPTLVFRVTASTVLHEYKNKKKLVLRWQWQTCLFVQSPDVELVEPDAVLVKEEMVEANMSQADIMVEDVPMIGDDGESCCLCTQHSPLCNADFYKSMLSVAYKTIEHWKLTLNTPLISHSLNVVSVSWEKWIKSEKVSGAKVYPFRLKCFKLLMHKLVLLLWIKASF